MKIKKVENFGFFVVLARFLANFKIAVTSEVQNENPSIVAHSNRQKLLFQMVYSRISKISFFDQKNRFFQKNFEVLTKNGILACEGTENPKI